MDHAVARADRRTVDAELRPVIVGYNAAGLFDKQFACRDVPRIETLFPEPIETAAGDIGHVDRRRSVAPDATRVQKKIRQVSREIFSLLEVVWKTGDD